ncbi:uncharacterized protein LOC136088552 isoform X2 [Hydra vulgaris]
MLRFNINYTHIIQFLKNIWCSKSVPKKTFATFFKNGEKSDVLPRSKVAAACFNKLENLVLEHNWQIHSIEKWKGELAERHYGGYKDIDIYQGCFFYSKIENKAKALITYGPYLEGFIGHVHGGAIATLHDEVAGIVATL